jgi:hypothetical protein
VAAGRAARSLRRPAQRTGKPRRREAHCGPHQPRRCRRPAVVSPPPRSTWRIARRPPNDRSSTSTGARGTPRPQR